MVDITQKNNTLRTAVAQAIVKVGHPETIVAIKTKTVPKGDVLAMSRAAGLLGIKKTALLLPDCHPLPIEYSDISYQINDLEIGIKVTVKTIYKTGVEVEAMHGASIVALNIYDMLKPIDKNVAIYHIKLLEKKGGKSDDKKQQLRSINAAVVVCSDTISAGKKEDYTGKVVITKLESYGITVSKYKVIADKIAEIQEQINDVVAKKIDLIILTGGTGLSPRDVTPEAVLPLLERRILGMEEAIRKYGQDRTPYSMLSRSVAGTVKNTLVLALPGATNGARESMDAIFPAVLHLFKVIKGDRHD